MSLIFLSRANSAAKASNRLTARFSIFCITAVSGLYAGSGAPPWGWRGGMGVRQREALHRLLLEMKQA